MADDKFTKILNLLIDIEGGYSNDKIDRGGETYCGISRKFHPSWEGWRIIDEGKANSSLKFIKTIGLVNSLEEYAENNNIKDLVYSFYKENYWNISSLDKINSIEIAFKIFDMNVNLGINRTAALVQNSINLISQTTEIKVDNIIGIITATLINEITNKKNMEEFFIKILTLQQGNIYMTIAKNTPSQKRFIKGWINRLHMSVNLGLKPSY